MKLIRLASPILLSVLIAAPAFAWGPRAKLAIVETAARVFSQEGRAPLASLSGPLRAGASESADTVKALMSGVERDPIDAVASGQGSLQGS